MIFTTGSDPDAFTALDDLHAYVETGCAQHKTYYSGICPVCSSKREKGRAAVAELRRVLELIAADTTAADLAQRIEFLKAALAEARVDLARESNRINDLSQVNGMALQHLREFNHVKGEPLDDVAAVAASAFGFSQHRAAAAEARADRYEKALRRISSCEKCNMEGDEAYLAQIADEALGEDV